MGGKRKNPRAKQISARQGKNPKVAPGLAQKRTPPGERITFSFELADDDDQAHPYHHRDSAGTILLAFLMSVSRLTWNEILMQRTDNRQKHHFQRIDTLSQRAQKRLTERNLTDKVGEDLFRFRLDGPGRLWGHVAEGVFYPIWWDARHEVYPVKKQ